MYRRGKRLIAQIEPGTDEPLGHDKTETARCTATPTSGWSRALGASLLLLVGLALFNAYPRWFHFCGDALVHLCVAEQLAAGHWFEFNANELTSASSSFGWTLLLAALLRMGSFELATFIVPIVGLAALLGSAWLIQRLGRQLGARPWASLLAGAAYLAIPGVMYNGLLGMENGVFALVVLAFVYSWSRARGAFAPAVLAGLAVLLRPEGWAILVMVSGCVVVPNHFRASRRQALAVVLGVCAIAAPAYLFHWMQTGLILPGSGLSRVMAARRDDLSFQIAGPSWLYLGSAARVLAYLPLFALGAYGAQGTQSDLSRRALLSTSVLLALGFSAYTLVTGAAHVARVSTWLFALVLPWTAMGLGRARALGRARLLGVAGLATLAVMAGETTQRFHGGRPISGGPSRAQLLNAVDEREARTERILSALCAGSCCNGSVPPRVGVSEIQLRFYLDQRVAISSFDGRAQLLGSHPMYSRFDARGCPDLDQQLSQPALLGMLEPPLRVFHGCNQPLARRLSEGWTNPERLPNDWRWSSDLPGLVRVCARRGAR